MVMQLVPDFSTSLGQWPGLTPLLNFFSWKQLVVAYFCCCLPTSKRNKWIWNRGAEILRQNGDGYFI
jgi:hypothetical protein